MQSLQERFNGIDKFSSQASESSDSSLQQRKNLLLMEKDTGKASERDDLPEPVNQASVSSVEADNRAEGTHTY